jgi:hypothetical protein
MGLEQTFALEIPDGDAVDYIQRHAKSVQQ